MQLRGGRWYGRQLRPGGAHGESLPGEWVIVEAGYLNQPWCLWHGAWYVLDQRTEVLGLSWTQRSFYLLAFVIGPQWDAMLSSGRFSKYTIKGWSYHGATGDHGDVGNATMQLTWTLVHEVRASCHEYELYEIARRNQEHAADQLEAIMGLRTLYPEFWKEAGDVVDIACSATYKAWNEMSHAFNAFALREFLQLRQVVARRNEIQQLGAQMRRRSSCQAFYTALYRTLKGRWPILMIIVRYCV